VSYTLIDHDLTPYSALEEIDGWLERVKGLLKERPDDDGLRLALQDIERIRKLSKTPHAGAANTLDTRSPPVIRP